MSQRKKTSHSLDSVAQRVLGIELDKEYQKSNWGGELSPGMIEYAAKDAQVLIAIAGALDSKIEDSGLRRVMEIERRALPAVTWMENVGLPLDTRGWTEYLGQVEHDIGYLKEQLNQLAPTNPRGKEWNWNSTQQVKEVFAIEGIELPNVKSETLARYDHPLIKPLLRYRKASKLVSHFGPSLLGFVEEDGRVYADWHQIGAETGRMSCSKPNLQQFPPVLRGYVRAPEGKALVVADYSQAELRIAAQVSGDKRMLAAYRRGEDLHATTAKSLMGRGDISKEERDLAKAVNFGLLYGQGANGLREYAQNKYGIEMTLDKAKHYRRRFFQTYPGLKAWHETQWRQLKQGNTRTRTLSGRRRRGVRSFTERVNTPIQGTGADGQKLALALLWERRHECPRAVPITCVHDEIVVECDAEDIDEAAAWLKKAMIDGMTEVLALGASRGQTVPVDVEVKCGQTWGDAQLWPPRDSEHAAGEKLAVAARPGSASIKVYTDYREPSADTYRQIDVCEECAEENRRDLGGAGRLQPGEAARCEICGSESSANI